MPKRLDPVDRVKGVAQCLDRVVQHPDRQLPDRGIARVTALRTPPGKVHRERMIPTQCLRERKGPDQPASKEEPVHQAPAHLGLVPGDRKAPVAPEDRRAAGDIKNLGPWAYQEFGFADSRCIVVLWLLVFNVPGHSRSPV